jgi:hypothetical protein
MYVMYAERRHLKVAEGIFTFEKIKNSYIVATENEDV